MVELRDSMDKQSLDIFRGEDFLGFSQWHREPIISLWKEGVQLSFEELRYIMRETERIIKGRNRGSFAV